MFAIPMKYVERFASLAPGRPSSGVGLLPCNTRRKYYVDMANPQLASCCPLQPSDTRLLSVCIQHIGAVQGVLPILWI
jgi:hypothetical protein